MEGRVVGTFGLTKMQLAMPLAAVHKQVGGEAPNSHDLSKLRARLVVG